MSDADEERVNEHEEREEVDQSSWSGWLGSKPWWQDEEEEEEAEEGEGIAVGAAALARTGSFSSGRFRNSRNCYVNANETASELCELAPHSTMNLGAGRVESPSPQDIRLLHDLVEDLSKEQDEKNRPRTEQVRTFFIRNS